MDPIEEILSTQQAEYKQYKSNESSEREKPILDPTIFAIHAEKGGVGKTTLCIHLAHTFASRGKKVLIIDCDSQRSATAWLFANIIKRQFGEDVSEFTASDYLDVENLLPPRTTAPPPTKKIKCSGKSTSQQQATTAPPPKTLFGVLRHSPEVVPAQTKFVTTNLFAVCGDTSTDLFDASILLLEGLSQLPVASGTDCTYLTKKPLQTVLATAKSIRADYVFLDLNPNKSALNRCLIEGAHYLIMPSKPDYYGKETMQNLERNLLGWRSSMVTFLNQEPAARKVKFLGYVINCCNDAIVIHDRGNARKTHKGPSAKLSNTNCNAVIGVELSAAEQIWATSIEEQTKNLQATEGTVAPNLCVPAKLFAELNKGTCLLAKIPTYAKIMSASSAFHIPAFKLSSTLLENFEATKLSTAQNVLAPKESLTTRIDADLRDVADLTNIFQTLATTIEKIATADLLNGIE